MLLFQPFCHICKAFSDFRHIFVKQVTNIVLLPPKIIYAHLLFFILMQHNNEISQTDKDKIEKRGGGEKKIPCRVSKLTTKKQIIISKVNISSHRGLNS